MGEGNFRLSWGGFILGIDFFNLSNASRARLQNGASGPADEIHVPVLFLYSNFEGTEVLQYNVISCTSGSIILPEVEVGPTVEYLRTYFRTFESTFVRNTKQGRYEGNKYESTLFRTNGCTEVLPEVPLKVCASTSLLQFNPLHF